MKDRRSCSHIPGIYRRFAGDRRGVAAVEFALLLPLMIAMYFGALEITDALTANRRVTLATQTVGDLVAQSAVITDHDMTDIFAATAAVMAPFDASNLKMRVTSVVADSNNNTKVAWSDGYNMAARNKNSTVRLPAGLTTGGDSVIYAEVKFTYTSLLGKYFTSPFVFTDEAYLRPRRSLQVARTN